MLKATTLEKKINIYFDHKPTLDQSEGMNKLARFIIYDKKKVKYSFLKHTYNR